MIATVFGLLSLQVRVIGLEVRAFVSLKRYSFVMPLQLYVCSALKCSKISKCRVMMDGRVNRLARYRRPK